MEASCLDLHADDYDQILTTFFQQMVHLHSEYVSIIVLISSQWVTPVPHERSGSDSSSTGIQANRQLPDIGERIKWGINDEAMIKMYMENREEHDSKQDGEIPRKDKYYIITSETSSDKEDALTEEYMGQQHKADSERIPVKAEYDVSSRKEKNSEITNYGEIQKEVIDGCPPYQLIWPCECTTSDEGDVTVACYGAHGPDMIHRALLPDYPSPHLQVLNIGGQSDLGILPKDILHEKTFEEMNLYGTGLQNIEEGAFDSCRNTLKIIRLNSNHLKNFTFHELPRFNKLECLAISDNQLTSIDGFVGLPPLSLTTLYANGNHISSLHPDIFVSLPNMTYLDLHANNISYIPPGVFLPLTKLEALFLKQNNIVHLSTGAFWFSTPILRQLDIQNIGLKTLDADVFRGVDISTYVSMDMNNLRHLYYDSFGTLLRNVSLEYGWLSLSGNWLNCECDVLWILEDETLQSHLHSANCRNLTYLPDLDYDAMAAECATSPLS